MGSWEDKCKKCGKCCMHKFYGESGIVYTGDSCKHLDVETRKCTVYEKRFIVNPACIKLTEENVKTFDWLPEDCGCKH